MIYSINLGQGLGEITFRMSREEIVNCIGTADKIYKTDFNCERWQYNKYLLELSFEPEDNFLLGWMEIYNKDVLLFNKKLIGLNQKEVLTFINKYLTYIPEIEDYGSFISVSYDEDWLELQFRFDKLYNINFGQI